MHAYSIRLNIDATIIACSIQLKIKSDRSIWHYFGRFVPQLLCSSLHSSYPKWPSLLYGKVGRQSVNYGLLAPTIIETTISRGDSFAL